MKGYESFAAAFDAFGDDEIYARIAGFTDDLIADHLKYLKKGTTRPEITVYDIACGTGKLCRALREMCYDVSGSDISEDCLTIAASKSEDIFYTRQDMTELLLPAPVDVVTCTLDSLNHLDSLESIKKTFKRVNACLKEGGLFLFDTNTPYKHEYVLADNVFVYENEDIYLVWANDFTGDRDSSVDMTIDIFIREGDVYRREYEEIREIAFEPEIISSALRSCGFEIISLTDGYTDEPVTSVTERTVFSARKI
ncbi:MAG: class I SAM-dependent methyltransferase [Oscillospiraceae bacterium]|nr:class I SAM-dependent methyltransferase [Oscillospiraceae bacterium]